MQLIKETPLNAFFSMNWFIYMCRLCALWWLSLILVPTMTYCSISMSHVTKRDNTKRTYGHRSNKSHSTCIWIEQIYQPGTIFIICIKKCTKCWYIKFLWKIRYLFIGYLRSQVQKHAMIRQPLNCASVW